MTGKDASRNPSGIITARSFLVNASSASPDCRNLIDRFQQISPNPAYHSHPGVDPRACVVFLKYILQ